MPITHVPSPSSYFFFFLLSQTSVISISSSHRERRRKWCESAAGWRCIWSCTSPSSFTVLFLAGRSKTRRTELPRTSAKMVVDDRHSLAQTKNLRHPQRKHGCGGEELEDKRKSSGSCRDTSVTGKKKVYVHLLSTYWIPFWSALLNETRRAIQPQWIRTSVCVLTLYDAPYWNRRM